MRLLMDTHVALWAIADSAKLPEDVRELLASRSNMAYYSIVSVWEVALKHAIRPDSMPIPEERFVELCDQTGFEQLALTEQHIYRIKTLTRRSDAPKHKDPFDRLLIAQAKEEGFTFLTHDQLLPAYEEPCIRCF